MLELDVRGIHISLDNTWYIQKYLNLIRDIISQDRTYLLVTPENVYNNNVIKLDVFMTQTHTHQHIP